MSRQRILLCVSLFLASDAGQAQSERPPVSETLKYFKWSGDVNVPDPVAISFDDQGRAYVTQTQRRKAQDLDIRQHRSWIPNDVGLQSVQEKRDFYHRTLAIGDDQKNSIHLDDFNDDQHFDYRDLQVISEKIHLLQDTDNDGTADRIGTFAEGFQTEVTGIAAGVLFVKGAGIYATIAPDVWRLRDTNDDGEADQREVIATGFGVHIAYAGHDMHGLTMGPDGKIYWSIGDKGISVAAKNGQRFHYPNQGGVMRCNPDGTDFEVFAHGLRNVQELAFDQFGNLFGVDNDADKPSERERFVFIVKDMDAGWRCNYQYRGNDYDPWVAEKLWVPWHEKQPSYIVPPISHSIDGPAGFAFNPGTALSPTYKDYFFLTGAPGGVQIAFQIKPDGASFAIHNQHQIGNSVPLVGINFGPDGGLYGVDWGGGYPLNQTGAVWKIDDPEFAVSELRQEVRKLIADGLQGASTQQLVQHLSHPDQRIRLKAQFELVNRNAINELTRSAQSEEALLARVHSVWGLGQLVRNSQASRKSSVAAQSSLVELLSDKETEIVRQVLRTLGDVQSVDGGLFVRFLNRTERPVRLAALQALAEHPVPDAVPALIEAADHAAMSETYLRFGLMRAFSACATSEQLAALRTSDNVLLKLAAVVALRRQASPLVAVYLDDIDPAVATEAALAIHDDFSIPAALPKLSSTLEQASGKTKAFIRRAINAGFRIGGAADASRLVKYACNPTAPRELRLNALAALKLWQDPPVLDRVTGRYRDFSNQKRTLDSEQIGPALSVLIKDKRSQLSAAALSVAANLGIRVDDQALVAIIESDSAASESRAEALNALHSQESQQLRQQVRKLLDVNDASLRIRALQLLAELNPAEATQKIPAILLDTSSVRERQNAVTMLGAMATRRADALLVRLLKARATDIRLEILEAASNRASQNPEIAALLQELESSRQHRAAKDPTVPYAECLDGGDVGRGRDLFQTHIGAQCVRCHRIGKQGSEVGPNLEDIATRRDPKYLLRAIVAPSADIDAKFRTQVVVLTSGKTIQGLKVASDDDTMTLADGQGKKVVVQLEDVDESFEQKISIMPEMKKTLSRREVRDLVAFLRSLKKKKK